MATPNLCIIQVLQYRVSLRRGIALEVVFNLNYAQIHFASVAAFVAGWQSS